MNIQDFEEELKGIHHDLSIRQNTPPQRVAEMYPDVLKIATITFRGVEVCTVPNGDIYDEPNGSYGVDLRGDGRFIRHRTRTEALQIVRETLARIEADKDFADQFFGNGEYSEAKLRERTEEKAEIIEEVSVDVKEVQSGALEEAK